MAESTIIKGTTTNGFKYSVDKRILSDFRFAQLMAKAIKPDNVEEQLTSLTDLVAFIIGKDNVDKFAETIAKKNDGFVPVQIVREEIGEIISALKVKN